MKLLRNLPSTFNGGAVAASPRAGLRAYQGAMLGRLVGDWVAQATSADSEIKTSLPALRDRSRQLGRDNDYVKGYFIAVEDNVVGTGIGFQAQVKMQRGDKLDKITNDAIESAWREWTKAESCHTAGTSSFEDIERMAIRNQHESGEFFVRMIKGQYFGASKVPFALELIEADMLDDKKSETLANGNSIRMGVELDQWQRPVAYWFLQVHPGDYQFSTSRTALKMHRRIPADEIIPLQMFDRPNQTRGVPALASAIMRLHQMGGYEEAEVIAARASAALMGFIETDGEEPAADGVEYDKQVSDFEPGMFKTLLPGQKVSVPDLHRPGGQFEPFMRMQLKGMAAGAAVSYSTISRDYSQSNFSSSRMDLLNERDHWRVIQKWMIRKFHQRVFEAWLEMAYLAGAVKLRGYEVAPEKFTSVKWMPRGWAWIDPVKEITAAKEAIKAGLGTQTSYAAQQGEDFEEIVVQRARERDLAKEHGLEFDIEYSKPAPPTFGGGKFGNKPKPGEETEDDDAESGKEEKEE